MPKKKVEQINAHLFIDIYKSNTIKLAGMKWGVNDCEMSTR